MNLYTAVTAGNTAKGFLPHGVVDAVADDDYGRDIFVKLLKKHVSERSPNVFKIMCQVGVVLALSTVTYFAINDLISEIRKTSSKDDGRHEEYKE